MKTLVLTGLLSLALVSASGQGTLNFANAAFGVDAPVRDVYGNAMAGTAWAADFYWAAGTVSDSGLLAPLNQPANFSATVPGYFFGGLRTIPGAIGGATITAQVRVWDTADGNSWEMVRASWSPTAQVAESSLFQVTLTAVPYPPANLTGLEPFSVVWIPIPEPGVLALGLVGLGVGLLLRLAQM